MYGIIIIIIITTTNIIIAVTPIVIITTFIVAIFVYILKGQGWDACLLASLRKTCERIFIKVTG